MFHKEFPIGRESYYFMFPLYITKNMYAIPTELAMQDNLQKQTKNITIILPSDGNFIVFLINVGETKISYMAKSLEGSTDVLFENVDISSGKRYNILVVGLFKNSGWIPRDGSTLIEVNSVGERAIIDVNSNSVFVVDSNSLVDESNWYMNDNVVFNSEFDNGYFAPHTILTADGELSGYNFPGFWETKWDWRWSFGPWNVDRAVISYKMNIEKYKNRPYKFDALFQNQRFIRAKIEGAFIDQWFAMADSIIYINNKIDQLSSYMYESSLINSTISSIVKLPVRNFDTNLMNILLSKSTSGQVSLTNNIFNNGDNIYTLNVSGALLNEAQNYNLAIIPKTYKTTIRKTLLSINTYNKWIELGTSNSFVTNLAKNGGLIGYQFEVITVDGINMNGIVVNSMVVDNIAQLHVAYSLEGLTALNDAEITFIANNFDPVYFDVEMKLYDVDLLARATYSQHTKNKVNGECIIYDEYGNVYKSFDVHTETNENGQEILVRKPRQ